MIGEQKLSLEWGIRKVIGALLWQQSAMGSRSCEEDEGTRAFCDWLKIPQGIAGYEGELPELSRWGSLPEIDRAWEQGLVGEALACALVSCVWISKKGLGQMTWVEVLKDFKKEEIVLPDKVLPLEWLEQQHQRMMRELTVEELLSQAKNRGFDFGPMERHYWEAIGFLVGEKSEDLKVFCQLLERFSLDSSGGGGCCSSVGDPSGGQRPSASGDDPSGNQGLLDGLSLKKRWQDSGLYWRDWVAQLSATEQERCLRELDLELFLDTPEILMLLPYKESSCDA